MSGAASIRDARAYPELAAQLQAVKLATYGDDDASALRDILFTWWEERFLSAKSGAPAVTVPDSKHS